MRSGGPTVGPGGGRARARGGQDWGQGGQGWGQGGHGPLAPPLATGLGALNGGHSAGGTQRGAFSGGHSAGGHGPKMPPPFATGLGISSFLAGAYRLFFPGVYRLWGISSVILFYSVPQRSIVSGCHSSVAYRSSDGLYTFYNFIY